jgi:hypothetical protein
MDTICELAYTAAAQCTGDDMRFSITVPLAGATLVMMLASCSGAQPQAGPAATAPPSQTAPATQAAATTSATPTEDQMASCVVTPAEVKAAFADWIGPGDVTIDLENTAPHTCSYLMPPGSLQLNGKGKKAPSSDTTHINIDRTSYTDPVPKSAGIYDTHVSWGGTTPEQVFKSTEEAERALAKASKRGAVVTTHPEIGGGAVFSGEGEITVATRAPYWYSGGVSGTKGDALYEPAMVALATAINAKVTAPGN